jgi:hypothetical protein
MDFTDQMSHPVKAVHQVWEPDGKHRKKARMEGTFLQVRFLTENNLLFTGLISSPWSFRRVLTSWERGSLPLRCLQRRKQVIQMLWLDNIWIQPGCLVLFVQNHRHAGVNFANHIIGRTRDVYTY